MGSGAISRFVPASVATGQVGDAGVTKKGADPDLSKTGVGETDGSQTPIDGIDRAPGPQPSKREREVASTTQTGVTGGQAASVTGAGQVKTTEALVDSAVRQGAQISRAAAAQATVQTLAIKGQLDYANQLLEKISAAPETLDVGVELAQLDTNLADFKKAITKMESQLHAARALLAEEPRTGDPADGKRHAEAQALLAAYTTQIQGHPCECGTLEGRIARAKDAVTTLVMIQATLDAAADPSKDERRILAGVDGEVRRLETVLQDIPADAPNRQQYEGAILALRQTADQITSQRQATRHTIESVAGTLGVDLGKERGIVANLDSIDRAIGLEPTPGPLTSVQLGERLGRIVQTQRQQASLIATMLQSDAGMSEQDLIGLGLLNGKPDDVVSKLQKENPALAAQFGLANATPGRLTSQERQTAFMVGLRPHPEGINQAMDRLYAAWRIDPSDRDRSRDLGDLAKLARTGKIVVEDEGSIAAMRQKVLVGRQSVSALEVKALGDFLAQPGGARYATLEQIAGDPNVDRRLRLTADKLDRSPAARDLLQKNQASRRLFNRGRSARGDVARVDTDALRSLADRIAEYRYPGEAGKTFDGKLLLDNFYDPTRLDADVKALYRAMKGPGTDEAAILAVLERLSPSQRSMVTTEFARHARQQGYTGESSEPGAIYNWLRGELSGWEYSKAAALMRQTRDAESHTEHLQKQPDAIIDSPGDSRAAELRTPAGRLSWQRRYFNIYREPFNLHDMGDKKGVEQWRSLDNTAAAALTRYEDAVQNGDPRKIETAEQEFTLAAGRAIAQHNLLSAGYGGELNERIATAQAWEEGIIVGSVIVTATAATIATCGAAAAAGWGTVAVVSAGFAAGTTAGTTTGFALRVEQEALHTGGLGNMDWGTIGTKTYGDFKMAAGSAVAAAVPTAGFARLQQCAWFIGRGATVGEAAVQVSHAAQKVSLGVHLANVGKNAAAGMTFNTVGSFGMRSVHKIADVATGTETPVTPDLDFSWKNLLIEMGSGAATGAVNPFLGGLQNLDDAAGFTRRMGAKGIGFTFDMGMNLADEAVRNVAYDRDPMDGLVQALLIGAPANIAGGMAGRQAALVAQRRAIRARQVLMTPDQLTGFIDFAQTSPKHKHLVTPDGTLNKAAAMADLELAVGAWDARPRVRTGEPAVAPARKPHAKDGEADPVTRDEPAVKDRSPDAEAVTRRAEELETHAEKVPDDARAEFTTATRRFAEAEITAGRAREQLDGLMQRLETTSAEDTPRLNREIETQLSNLHRRLNDLDQARTEVERVGGQHLDVDAHKSLKGAVGDKQAAAVKTFLDEFYSGGFAERVGSKVLGADINGVSPRVAAALARAFDSKFSSVDMAGAPNVQHVSTVLDGVLAKVQAAKVEQTGDPRARLTQAEVDDLVLMTVLTDAQAKGRSPAELESMAIAYVTCGGEAFDSFGRLWEKMKAVNPALAPDYMGFMAGTLAHGIPSFKSIQDIVTRAYGPEAPGPGPTRTQRMYEGVLGHHMAGFIADGFAAAKLRPDFDAMQRAGHLTADQAARLGALYDAAIPLAGEWRPKINAAYNREWGEPPSLTKAERAKYLAAAQKLQDAIDGLPDGVRAQLLADDVQQFTEIGIPKWLAMAVTLPGDKVTMKGGQPVHEKVTRMGDLLVKMYRLTVQGYYEESIARGPKARAEFEDGATLTAERLGMKLVPDGAEHSSHFAEASPGDIAHLKLAAGVVADPKLRDALLASHPELAGQLDGTGRLGIEIETRVVDWFRNQPLDPNTAARIASHDPPEFAAVEGYERAARGFGDTDFATKLDDAANPRRVTDAQLDLMNASGGLAAKLGVSWEQQQRALRRNGIELDSPHSLRQVTDPRDLRAIYGTLKALQAKARARIGGQRRSFPTQQELRRAEFNDRVRSDWNLTPEQANQLNRLRAEVPPDAVSGFENNRARIDTTERAIRHVADTGETAVYVEADIKNLGGLNAELGHTGADRIYGQITDIVGQELSAIGVDVSFFRHGGDEVSAVLVGPALDKQVVQQAMRRAQIRVEKLVIDAGLADIPHVKHPGDPTQKGSGIAVGVVEITGGDTVRKVHTEGGNAVEYGKKHPPPPYRGEPLEVPASSTWRRPATDSAPALNAVADLPHLKTPKGRQRLPSDYQLRQEAFIELAGELGISRSEAKRQFDIDGRTLIDPLTTYESNAARWSSAERVLHHVQKTGETAVYVEADIRNLNGLNSKLGPEGANAIFRRFAKAFENTLGGLGEEVDVHLFRHGGDEISAIVVGADADLRQKVDTALRRAQLEIGEIVRQQGLENLPHPKHSETDAFNGTGIEWGTTELVPRRDIPIRDNIVEIFSAADLQVERAKQSPRSGTT